MIARVRQLLTDRASLGGQAVGAGLWTVTAMGVQYPLRLATNLVMTRLLAPEAFGLMATVTVLHVGLGMLSDVGLAQSVMRRKGAEEPRFLHLVWTVQIVRALGIVAVLCLLGGLVMAAGPSLAAPDSVYADERLPWMIWVSSIAFALNGFKSTAILIEKKRMRLKRLTLMEIAAQIAGVAAMVAFGVATGSVWALVVGLLVSSLVGTGLSHLVLGGPRMRLHWDRAEAAELWSFGKWLIGASLGGYVLNHGDKLIFGMLMPASTLGIYAIAAIWANLGFDLVQRLGQSFLLPALGRTVKEDPPRAEGVLGKSFLVMLAISISMVGLVLVFANFLIEHLYTEAYAGLSAMAELIAIKIVFLAFRPFYAFLVMSGDTRYAFMARAVGAGLLLCTLWALAGQASTEVMIVAFNGFGAVGALLILLHPTIRAQRPTRAAFAALAVLSALVAVYAHSMLPPVSPT